MIFHVGAVGNSTSSLAPVSSRSDSQSKTTALAVGLGIGCPIVVVAIAGVMLQQYRRQRRKLGSQPPGGGNHVHDTSCIKGFSDVMPIEISADSSTSGGNRK